MVAPPNVEHRGEVSYPCPAGYGASIAELNHNPNTIVFMTKAVVVIFYIAKPVIFQRTWSPISGLIQHENVFVEHVVFATFDLLVSGVVGPA